MGSSEIFSSIVSKFRFNPNGPAKVVSILGECLSSKLTTAQFFSYVLDRLGIELDEQEMQFCIKRYSTLDCMDVGKFLSSLEINVPKEHGDPEAFAESLPQPYRFIWKIIEFDVLDTAWLEITRLHSEYLLDSSGLPLNVPRNLALQVAIKPSSISTRLSDATCISEAPVGSTLFITGSKGTLTLFDPTSDRTLQSIQIISVADDVNGALHENAPIDSKQTKCISPLRICGQSNLIIGTEGQRDRILRVAVTCAVERLETPPVKSTESIMTDPKGKAPPPAKKGSAPPAEILEKRRKCYIAVAESTLGNSTDSIMGSMRIAHKIFVDLLDNESPNSVTCHISPDGDLLSVTTASGYFLYSLSPILDSPLLRKIELKEDGEEVDTFDTTAIDDGDLELSTPSLELKNYSMAQNRKLLAAPFVCLYPKKPTKSSSVSDTANSVVVEPLPPPSQFYHYGVSLIFEQSSQWELLGLYASNSLRKDEVVPTPAAVTTAVTNTIRQENFSSFTMAAWKLQSNVTAYEVAEGKTILALGLEDGSIVLWNVVSRTIESVVARHEAPITTICFCRSGNNKALEYNLVCGALDGTSSFSKLKIPTTGFNAFQATFLASSPSPESESTTLTTRLVEFRHDVMNAAMVKVSCIRELALVVMEYTDGTISVCDSESGLLLGRICLFTGIEGKKSNWRPFCNLDAATSFHVTDDYPNHPSQAPLPQLSFVPKRRAKRFEILSPNIFALRERETLLACPKSSLQVFYWREGKRVLASFSISTLIQGFCPGIAAVAPDLSSWRVSPEDLYRLLPASDRHDPKLNASQVANFLSAGGNRSSFNSGDNNKLSSNSQFSSTNGNGNRGRNNSVGALSSTSSSLSANSSSKLTKEKLRALENSFDATLPLAVLPGFGGASHIDINDNIAGPLSAYIYGKILTPSTLASTSAESSAPNKLARKKRLLKSLTELSNVLS